MTGLADSVIARIIKQRNLVAAMDDHCRSISAQVTSRDQNVSVEVDGFGAMTGLRLGPNAHKLGPDTRFDVLSVANDNAAWSLVVISNQKNITEIIRIKNTKPATDRFFFYKMQYGIAAAFSISSKSK